jgi:riboflavin kinase/FMN adenylyltransferase
MKKLPQPITFSGAVIHGNKYGTHLGFPTANIDNAEFLALGEQPAAGVYSGSVKLPNRERSQAGIVIMDQENGPKIEAHLIDFEGDLYGQRVMFTLESFVREYREFESEEGLKEQIGKDLRLIQKLTI